MTTLDTATTDQQFSRYFEIRDQIDDLQKRWKGGRKSAHCIQVLNDLDQEGIRTMRAITAEREPRHMDGMISREDGHGMEANPFPVSTWKADAWAAGWHGANDRLARKAVNP